VKTSDILVDVFLIVGVACQFICCLGVVVMPTVFDRLHFVGAGTTLGPLLIGAAVLVRQTTSSAGIETIVVMALIVLLSPVLMLATVRAARRLEMGTIGPTPDERRGAS
jgi:monovalent cation/proton antiporter MnhG/PhaG subunit